jgi:hypothetical protein
MQHIHIALGTTTCKLNVGAIETITQLTQLATVTTILNVKI